MKGRTIFSPTEIASISSLLHEIRHSTRPQQKAQREQLRRKYRFYISDFTSSTTGFTAADLDALVRSGRITVKP